MDKLANARTKEFRKRHRETSSDSKANPKAKAEVEAQNGLRSIIDFEF